MTPSNQWFCRCGAGLRRRILCRIFFNGHVWLVAWDSAVSGKNLSSTCFAVMKNPSTEYACILVGILDCGSGGRLPLLKRVIQFSYQARKNQFHRFFRLSIFIDKRGFRLRKV